jgi:hypothetical protein
MSDPDHPDQDPPPTEGGDEVTVGAWIDGDETPVSEPLEDEVVREPAPASPGLWARLMRALRGTT